MKVVITSDWHLDALTDGVRRWEEVEALVDHTVNVAIEESASLYVMCGDLCDPDGWNSVRAMSKLIQCAIKLDNSGVAFIAVAGNHDVVEDGLGTTMMTPLRNADVAHHVFEEPAELVFANPNAAGDDLHIVGLPFTPSSHAYNPEAVVKGMGKSRKGERTVVFGHLNLEGISAGSETTEMARGRDVFWPIDVLKRKWPNATLIGGHYHRAQEYATVNIIGSLARLRHDEEEHTPSLMILDL